MIVSLDSHVHAFWHSYTVCCHLVFNIFCFFFFLSLHLLQVANNPCSNLLSAHFRLDGHAHVNPLHKVIQGSSQTYLFFTPSEVSGCSTGGGALIYAGARSDSHACTHARASYTLHTAMAVDNA